MKITVKRAATMTLSQFADLHGLEMEIVEHVDHKERWSAAFRHVSIVEGYVCVGACGRGDDPAKAIAEYVSRIIGQTIKFWYNGEDKKIVVPDAFLPEEFVIE